MKNLLKAISQAWHKAPVMRNADFSQKEITDQLSQKVLHKCKDCGREGFSDYFCLPKKFTWDNIQISETEIEIRGYCRKCGGSKIIPIARICFCGKEMDNPSKFFCSEECKNRHFS